MLIMFKHKTIHKQLTNNSQLVIPQPKLEHINTFNTIIIITTIIYIILYLYFINNINIMLKILKICATIISGD